MKGPVVVDANLLLLPVVGNADPRLIETNKRLRDDYTCADFDMLGLLIAEHSEIVLVAHALTEAGNLARQIAEPAKRVVQAMFRTLVESTSEIAVSALTAVQRPEFETLGLSDAALRHVCTIDLAGTRATLLTADRPLAAWARRLGYSVTCFHEI